MQRPRPMPPTSVSRPRCGRPRGRGLASRSPGFIGIVETPRSDCKIPRSAVRVRAEELQDPLSSGFCFWFGWACPTPVPLRRKRWRRVASGRADEGGGYSSETAARRHREIAAMRCSGARHVRRVRLDHERSQTPTPGVEAGLVNVGERQPMSMGSVRCSDVLWRRLAFNRSN